jgi:hypothetical protein
MITKTQLSDGKWAVLWANSILAVFSTEREADAYLAKMERKVTPVGVSNE